MSRGNAPDKGIELIVGLGNPGAEHLMDRHNVGFWFADALAQRCEARFGFQRRFHGDVARGNLRKHELRILKPATYMNNSGQAVQALIAYYKLEPEQVLVIHDELDLPAGIVRLKRGGGHGGHNGLRSIMAHIGPSFLRVRLGVGHPGRKEAVVGHVLQRASRSDEERILEAMADALDVLPTLLGQGEQRAMHKLHSREKKAAKPPKAKAADADKRDADCDKNTPAGANDAAGDAKDSQDSHGN